LDEAKKKMEVNKLVETPFSDLYQKSHEELCGIDTSDFNFSEKVEYYVSWYKTNKPFLEDCIEHFPSYTPSGNIPQCVRYKCYPENSKLIVIGDLHGGFHVLLRMMNHWVSSGYMKDDWTLEQNVHVLFLGDLVDRGCYGYAVVALIGYLHQKNPDCVIVNRGNHEELQTAKSYGFLKELILLEKNVPASLLNQKGFEEQYTKALYELLPLEKNASCLFFRFDKDPEYFYAAHGLLPLSLSDDCSIKAMWPPNELTPDIEHNIRWSDLVDSDWFCEPNPVGGRPGVPQQIVREYCHQYKIKLVLRGHEDSCSTRVGSSSCANLHCTEADYVTGVCQKPVNKYTESLVITTSSAVPYRTITRISEERYGTIKDFAYVVVDDSSSTRPE
jgi:hypothetical protein